MSNKLPIRLHFLRLLYWELNFQNILWGNILKSFREVDALFPLNTKKQWSEEYFLLKYECGTFLTDKFWVVHHERHSVYFQKSVLFFNHFIWPVDAVSGHRMSACCWVNFAGSKYVIHYQTVIVGFVLYMIMWLTVQTCLHVAQQCISVSHNVTRQ